MKKNWRVKMNYPSEKTNRKFIRLKNYDYRQPGWYFVTICVHNKKCLLGNIDCNKMHLSTCGEIVHDCWCAIPKHFPFIELDMSVIMPNHFHGIVVITENDLYKNDSVGATHASPLQDYAKSPARQSLGAIIGSFKSAVTKRINNLNRFFGEPFWQRNYYEHIIRDEPDLNRIRQYIDENPLKWMDDRYYMK